MLSKNNLRTLREAIREGLRSPLLDIEQRLHFHISGFILARFKELIKSKSGVGYTEDEMLKLYKELTDGEARTGCD